MAITQGICNSFKEELLDGIHNFNTGGDVFKIALFTSAASIGPSTTQYTTGGEVSGAGYTAGGITLTGQSTTLSGGTAFVDFNDAQWAGATFTARGALIYNSTDSNKAVMVLDFGSDKVASASTFTVQFPSADVTNAILRLT
jgi:hypothetical protein